jgi:putative transposase
LRGSEIDAIARSTRKSAVRREFVSRTREHLVKLMSRPLGNLRSAVVMLDGIELKGRCCVVSRAVDTDGVKHPPELWDGSTENATVATRCWRTWSSAASMSSRMCWSCSTAASPCAKPSATARRAHAVQRCVRRKERNVLGRLPERDQPLMRRRLRAAWALEDYDRALEQLRTLADELARSRPGEAASLREGMWER